MTIECKDCKEKQRIIKTLQRKLNFEREINEIDIKKTILIHIQQTNNPDVKQALQELFLDIYVYPEDIFEQKTITTLLNDIEKRRNNYEE